MKFTILRTQKLKTQSTIRGAGKHNARTQKTLNADLEKDNEIIIDGGPDLHATVMNRIKKAGAKHRSNSVLAQEVFMSASPEFFRPGDPTQAGEYDQNLMQAWKKESMCWLKDNFDDRIVDCRLHLDESTPHIHAVVVPLTADNRLSAFELFSRKTLSFLQTSYAKQLKSLGLKRGIKGSKAKHIDIKQYYADVNSKDLFKLPRVKPPPGAMLLKKQREEYATKLNKSLLEQLTPTFRKATDARKAKKIAKDYQRTAKDLSEQYDAIKHELEEATDKARSTPLELILEKTGLEPDPKDKKQWIGAGHRITLSESKFYDHKNNYGGGGAIDLVKHLQNCSFKNAIAWLGQTIDPKEAAKSIRADAEQLVKELSQNIDLTFCPPKSSPQYVQKLKKYLKNERMIDPIITDPLIAEGRIYATEKNIENNNGSMSFVNAVFLCSNSNGLTGAEIKGLSGNYSGMSKNSDRKNGAFSVGDVESKHIVFVESAIDALSYKQLHPEPCFVISTAGATTTPFFIEILKGLGWRMTVAYDNDEIGYQFALKFVEKYPEIEIEIPRTKDWNSDLKEVEENYRAWKTKKKKVVGRIQSFQDKLFNKKYDAEINNTLNGLFIGTNPADPAVNAFIFGNGVDLLDHGAMISCYGSDLQHQAEIAINIAQAKGWDLFQLEIDGSVEWINAVKTAVAEQLEPGNYLELR
ncbi:MAG: hypothetical protein GY718_05690 [Lentisphaerae bacterium]|nr:hypothetical protein [Lentisphaerota bacterium]